MKPYIPQPCHEDWNAMTENEKGRHCDVCSKVVVDFTNMSDAEVVDYLQQHAQQKTCGHFRSNQLSQKQKIEIDLAKLPKTIPFKSLLLACFISFFSSIFFVSCMGKAKVDDSEQQTMGVIAIIDSTQTKASDSLHSNLADGNVKIDTNQFDPKNGEVVLVSDSLRNNQNCNKPAKKDK
ncbi:MAG: hypothetical protein U0U67_00855 [Chitinophagales bacterium]